MSPKQFLPYPWPLWWIFSLLNYFSFLSQPWLSLHLHFIVLQMLDPQHCLFIYFSGSLLDFDHTSPLMYDFPISSSSPPFDMLVKLLLKILLTHFLDLSFLCFIHNLLSASPFFLNKCRFGFIPWFLIPKYLFWFKKNRCSAPFILMFVYPNHLKNVAASSSCGAKSKQLDTIPPAHFSVHVGWRIQSTTIESSLSKVMTLSLPLQSWRWSQRWTSWRRHVSSTTKLEDITMLRSTPWSPINNV